MLTTTVGQLMVNEALPEDLRDYNRVLDKKGIAALLQEVAEKHPDRYRVIAKQLSDVGHSAATTTGGYSFGLGALRQSLAARKMRLDLGRELRDIYADRSLSEEEREQRIIQTVGRHQKKLVDDVMKESEEDQNPLAIQVVSGARGNKFNINSLRGADLLYTDHKGRVLPIPVMRSYAMGLRPHEYFAGAFGARKGVIDLKAATQDAGFFCLAEGTLVRLPNGGTIAIEKVRSGDVVLGADADQNTMPVRVSAVFSHGPKEVWRYRFRVGKARDGFVTISATESHKVLGKVKCGRGTGTIAELRPLANGKNLRLVLPRGFNDVDTCHDTRAGILGLLLSEGGLTGNNVTFSTADQSYLSAIEDCLVRNNMSCQRRKGKEYEYTIYDEQPIKRSEFRPLQKGERRSRLWQWMDDLGLSGKLAWQKTMPDVVYEWDNAAIAEMLSFLFEGDGSIGETNLGTFPVIRLGMTAAPVVEAARDLLAMRFGIHSVPVRRRPAEMISGAEHDCYTLSITTREAVERFVTAIPVCGSKGRKLHELWKNSSPTTRDDSEFLLSFIDREYLGLVETYDIEVDHPSHMFVLQNGAIVSNSKQIVQAAHRLLVSQQDDENPYDPATPRGLPVDTDDMDSEGALLAHPTGGYARNTVLTPKILKELKADGIDQILVRSPAVGGPRDGGVFQRDVGVRERGGLSPLGDYVGIAAAQALAEPVTQAQISSKHSGGVVGAGAGAISGFKHINQLVQVPRTFQGGAAHAQVDGHVTRVREAPQGGYFVEIGGKEHYVGQGYPLKVKKGDEVEAGDVLSAGTPNPSEIVKHKGVGEGRRYLVQAFRQALEDSGTYGNRRNIELLARGLINHVRLTDEVGDWVQDDVVPYQLLESQWKPRAGHMVVPPSQSRGYYLERPVLHYSVGTKIQPSMLKQMQQHGVKSVYIHRDPPPFQPEMVRGMANAAHDPDWMTRMLGSYQKSSLLEGARRGAVSDEGGTSYVPALARGVDFGQKGPTQGWKDEDRNKIEP